MTLLAMCSIFQLEISTDGNTEVLERSIHFIRQGDRGYSYFI